MDSKCVILCLRVSADNEYLCMGTETGFEVFKIPSLLCLVKRNLTQAVTKIEPFGATNVYALTQVSPSTLFVWDENVVKPILKRTFEQEEIGNLRYFVGLVGQCLAVVTYRKIYVFRVIFQHLSVLEFSCLFETGTNLYGLCSCTQKRIAFPGRAPGHLSVGTFEHKDKKHLYDVKAHESDLTCIVMNDAYVATASERGTVIRLFSLANDDLVLLQEMRRGTYPSFIPCLVFDSERKRLAALSSTGTIHVFPIHHQERKDNPTTLLRSFTKSLGLTGRSTTRFYVPSKQASPHLLCFQKDNDVLHAILANGTIVTFV